MTIRNKEAYSQYRAHDDHGTTWAVATNKSISAIFDIAKEHGLVTDKGDQAEDLVAAIFAYLWDSNHKDA